MTYCLAMRMRDGLVFLSDTRTNAGVDNVSTYRKLHVFRPAPDRLFVLQSAGNLATTHEVLDRLMVDLEAPNEHESLASASHLFEVALYVGRRNQEVANAHAEALNNVGSDGTATFILGGQIGDAPPDIFLVYPEGNYIRASDERPFLQIGETKYGKFLLDFAVNLDIDLVTATKVALGSMMSTARANVAVGPPYDAAVYRTDSFDLDEYRFEADSFIFRELAEVWERHLVGVVHELDVNWSELRDADRP